MWILIFKIVTLTGPVILTCIQCSHNWTFILIALSKLAPDTFLLAKNYVHGYDYDDGDFLDDNFRCFIAFATFALCVCGWVASANFVFIATDHSPNDITVLTWISI
ncbi:28437_t:CDS:1, partial [Racocetra persica]